MGAFMVFLRALLRDFSQLMAFIGMDCQPPTLQDFVSALFGPFKIDRPLLPKEKVPRGSTVGMFV